MNKFNFLLLAGLFLGLAMTGCDDDDDDPIPTPEPTGNSKYVLAAVGSDQLSVYLLTADDLSAGSLSLAGNGIEAEGYTFVIQNNTLFGSVFGGYSQGPTTAYNLDATGKLVKGVTLNTPSCNFAVPVNEDAIVQGSVSFFADDPTTSFTILNAVDPKITGTASYDMFELAGNGEMGYINGLFPLRSNELWAPYRCIKGASGNEWGSDYVDSAWVAIFTYPEMTVKKIIRDNRTSYIGEGNTQQGLEKIDNGDIYAFSTARQGSAKPSSVIRIKSGTEAFDQSYLFDLEAVSDGSKCARVTYVGGTRFLAEMYTDADIAPGATSGSAKLAVIDVDKKTVTWVANSPAYSLSVFITPTYVESDKNTVDIPITDATTGVVSIYRIDAATAMATRGVDITGASALYAIKKLTY